MCWPLFLYLYANTKDFVYILWADCISIELIGYNVIISCKCAISMISGADLVLLLNWLTVMSEYVIAYAF